MTRVVLVLGMHRSGTSPVTRALKCFGAELGALAEWVGDDNRTGFHEHQGVLQLNQQLLGELERTWDDPRPWDDTLDLFMRMHPSAGLAHDTAVRGLEHDFGDCPLVGIKEPRLCRLLPFWRPVFGALRWDVSVIEVVRHPEAVAASLFRRDKMPRTQALSLWLEYVRRGQIDADPAWPTVTVQAEEFMRAPIPQVQRIARALGLVYDRAALDSFAGEFLDPALWHPTDPKLSPTGDVATEWWLARMRATK